MQQKRTDANPTFLDETLGLEEACRAALAGKNSFPFDALCRLAESAGFVLDRRRGSHLIYKHPTHILDMGLTPSDRMNFQPRDGKAKPYQVEELVSFIRLAMAKGDHGE